MRKIYPIGTIVKIAELENHIMISGIMIETVENNKLYDYCAFDYPMGYDTDANLHLFNEESIQEVKHMGYVTAEHSLYAEALLSYHKLEEYENTDIDKLLTESDIAEEELIEL